MTLRILLTASLMAIVSAVNSAAQPAPAQTPPGNAKSGQTLYMKIGCYQCHGSQGQGGAAGPRLGPAPMVAYRAFAAYVRAPRAEMPPYTAKVVSDQELADMYAFLAALPSPPAVRDIPLLDSLFLK
jgi:ubiquinol-cytochrome c reductase cytochrome c subunit